MCVCVCVWCSPWLVAYTKRIETICVNNNHHMSTFMACEGGTGHAIGRNARM